MKLYLVGGAVRDKLLGKTPKDMDYVLVGGTEEHLLTMFPEAKKVGSGFPVYLTNIGQVALARREKKIGIGYEGFSVDFGPEVTLEEDLKRRDLTINAMAMDVETEEVIDPYGGRIDLDSELLRHVSSAFRDDPLRVYRLARFSATLDFSIDGETMDMARSISEAEIVSLSKKMDRVRGEFLTAMAGISPHQFIRALDNIGILHIHFPEIAALKGVPAGPDKYHSEGDALMHTLMVLKETCKLTTDINIRVAALFHDLGKAKTPPEKWPFHHDHEELGVEPIEGICQRLRLSKDILRCSTVASREHLNVHRFGGLRPTRKVDVIEAADKTVMKAEGLAIIAKADGLGRIPSKHSSGATLLEILAPVVRTAEIGPIPESLKGEHIGLHIRARKASAIRKMMREISPEDVGII